MWWKRENALGCCTRAGTSLQLLGLSVSHFSFMFDSYVIAGARFEHHGYTMQLLLPPSGEPCRFDPTTCDFSTSINS